jgi:DNA-binding NarL/FixJ family response regulator
MLKADADIFGAQGSAERQPSEHAQAKIILLDRRILLREIVAAALSATWPELKVTTASPDSLGTSWPADSFDLCLLSVVGRRMDNLELSDDLRRVTRALPGTAVVVLGEDEYNPAISHAVCSGVLGYFSTAIRLNVLVRNLQLVMLGGSVFPAVALGGEIAVENSREANLAANPWLPARAGLFTPRELDVLRCLSVGKPNKLIAYELGMCETTVKVHLRHIFRKLGTTNRTHAALLAREMLEISAFPE